MKHKRPHQLRFLRPLRWAILAIACGWFFNGAQSAICSMQSKGVQCLASIPAWLGDALFVVMVLAIAASGYRFWLDFHKGEYYLDLTNPHWRNR